MPRQRRPPSSGQQLKAIVEAVGDLFDAKRGEARGRHFDRKRNPVKAPADRCDRCYPMPIWGQIGSAARARSTNNLTAP